MFSLLPPFLCFATGNVDGILYGTSDLDHGFTEMYTCIHVYMFDRVYIHCIHDRTPYRYGSPLELGQGVIFPSKLMADAGLFAK